MKTFFSALCFFFFLHTGYSQDSAAALKMVTVTFYNNSLLPKKCSFISYAPDEAGNGTVQVLLLPRASSKQVYKAGTRVYLADSKQVDRVMSGKKLEDKPFRVISAADDGAVINLNKE